MKTVQIQFWACNLNSITWLSTIEVNLPVWLVLEKPLPIPWPRSSARFCAARAFLNQYTTLLTSSGLRPRRESNEFNCRTYDWICWRDGCGFSWNHRCNFGNSISGSKLVRMRVFWFEYCEWTVCNAGCTIKLLWWCCGWWRPALWLSSNDSRLVCIFRLLSIWKSAAACKSTCPFCAFINGRSFWVAAFVCGANWLFHHWSNARHVSSDISLAYGNGPW